MEKEIGSPSGDSAKVSSPWIFKVSAVKIFKMFLSMGKRECIWISESPGDKAMAESGFTKTEALYDGGWCAEVFRK